MYHTEIRVKGKINPDWSEWFGELQMQESISDETVLVGVLPDMAAVYGIISGLGSFVIPLISVCCTEEIDTTVFSPSRSSPFYGPALALPCSSTGNFSTGHGKYSEAGISCSKAWQCYYYCL